MPRLQDFIDLPSFPHESPQHFSASNKWCFYHLSPFCSCRFFTGPSGANAWRRSDARAASLVEGARVSWHQGAKCPTWRRRCQRSPGPLGGRFFPGQMDGYKIIIYKSSAQVFQASRAVYNRCLGDRCTMTLFLLVWFLHQKGAGCYSASPDAIWFGHHGYSQSCKGCDHKQRCSTGSPRTSHCLSRFQCLDYWLACLASGRWLFSAGAAAARFQLTWMLPWMAVLVSTSRALVGEGGPHVRCTWLATTLKFVDLVVWCPTRHRYVFGERHPSDWDSKRAGQHVDSDCTWLEPAQTPWVALVLFFYLALGRPVLSIVSLIFFCWRGWFSQSDLHNLDFPFLFSALHYSCASWALVNGRAYLIQRSVRVPTSQCWRHLRVVLWRSPTACGIPWKPGGGKLSRRPSRCIQSSLLDMNLVLRGTATAVRAHRLSYSILRIFTHTFIQTISKHNTSSTAQGGGGSFKNRKPVGKVGCCESRMAGRSHWWIERWLMPPLFLSLSLTIYLPTNLSTHVSIDLSIYLWIYLSIYICLSISLFHLSICLAV